MPTYPLVSIIIPTKNEERNIIRCLKALTRQAYPNIEIILIDNYSTDKTISLAKPFVNKTIVAGPERSAQRNHGAKKAKGDWLLFVDADMEASSNLITECVALASKSSTPPIIVINEEAKGYDFWGKALALERKTYRYSPTYVTAARFFPKSDFLKLKGYDTTLVAGEDWDLTQRFKKKGYSILMTKKSNLAHHEARASIGVLLRKELFYIKNISGYSDKHPEAFSNQKSLLYRGQIYVKAWRLLMRYPVQTAAFLLYKFIVFLIWQYYDILPGSKNRVSSKGG